jgi:hypothetical protein
MSRYRCDGKELPNCEEKGIRIRAECTADEIQKWIDLRMQRLLHRMTQEQSALGRKTLEKRSEI